MGKFDFDNDIVSICREGQGEVWGDMFSSQALSSSNVRKFANVPLPFNRLAVEVDTIKKYLSPNSFEKALTMAYSGRHLRYSGYS